MSIRSPASKATCASRRRSTAARSRDAWSSSTMFRGIEIILQGPRSARRVGVRAAHLRRLHHGARDRVDPRGRERDRRRAAAQRAAAAQPDHGGAVRAGPRRPLLPPARARLGRHRLGAVGRSGEDRPRWRSRSRTGRCRARSTSPASAIASRRSSSAASSGPFANAYWGHPAYRLPPEANLMAVAHYLEALDWQREFIKMHAVLGGKNPHLQSFLVGGMATPVDPDSQAALNAGTIAQLKQLDREGARLRRRGSTFPTCWPSPSFYKDWAGHGRGVGNYLVYGEYPEDDDAEAAAVPAARHHPRPRPVEGRAVRSRPRSPSTSTHSWYEYQRRRRRGAASVQGRDDAELHRARSRRTSGSTPTRSTRWLKSPRYDDEPMEVGPLARMLVAYVSGPRAGQDAGRRAC